MQKDNFDVQTDESNGPGVACLLSGSLVAIQSSDIQYKCDRQPRSALLTSWLSCYCVDDVLTHCISFHVGHVLEQNVFLLI